MTHRTPTFQPLAEEECRTFLEGHHVGRIAFTLHDRVDIEPISYVFDDGWIFGRTSIGTKLGTLAHHPWCAFEVDEVRAPFDWTSVVAKGSFYLLDPEESSPDTYERALTLLRKLVPGTFTRNDPAPHRSILFGIFVHELTGRRSQPNAG